MVTAKKQQRSRLEQAAILLLSVEEKSASTIMQSLSREEVLRLSETMARMNDVKLNQIQQALSNFFSDYREQSGINGTSRSYLQNILSDALGGEIARSVINSIYGDEIRSRMTRLQWVDAYQLAALIDQEHLQLQSVFLALLPPEVAAQILTHFEVERQNDLLFRIAQLNDINHDVIEELDSLIDRGIAVLSEHGSKVVGIKQAANIVNRVNGNQQQILEQLGSRDPEVLDKLKDEMYEFFILSRQSDTTLQRIMEEIELEDWAVALKGTEQPLRQAIYDAIPKRQVQQLQNISNRLGPIPISRIEQVRKTIMANVRELAEANEIQLSLFTEQTLE